MELLAKNPADRPWDAAAAGQILARLRDRAQCNEPIVNVSPIAAGPSAATAPANTGRDATASTQHTVQPASGRVAQRLWQHLVRNLRSGSARIENAAPAKIVDTPSPSAKVHGGLGIGPDPTPSSPAAAAPGPDPTSLRFRIRKRCPRCHKSIATEPFLTSADSGGGFSILPLCPECLSEFRATHKPHLDYRIVREIGAGTRVLSTWRYCAF